MKKEAEEHAEEDKKRVEETQGMNEAEAMVYTAEKMLSDLGDKISEDAKKKIAEKTEALKNALKDNNAKAVKTAKQELEKEMQSASAELYKQSGPQTAGPGSPEGEGPSEEEEDDSPKKKKKGKGGKVVDADFKMEDEDKK
jgi:molecular chaperone DnaK